MAAQAKVIIKGQNDIGSAVKSAAGDLSSLKNAANKLGGTLKTALSVTAIIASIKLLSDAVAGCFSEFSDAERSYKQLALALKDTSAYTKITSVIEGLSSQTLSSKGDIEAMVAELAALGKNADEIEAISSAAVYLSNVTGRDLNSSMTTLLNTYNGTTTQLERLGINLDGVTREELAQGEAIDVVIEKLGDYSKMMAEDDSRQHLVNMSNTWGDIRQQIGGVLDYNFGPWLAKLDGAFSGIKTNLMNIINYVGAVVKNFPEVFRLSLSTIWEMIKRTFEWDSLKLVFLNTVKNIGIIATAMLNAVFETIPKLLAGVVSGVINWIAYIAVNIESSILGAFQGAINKAGQEIQGTWVGKIFGLGDKLATLDVGAGEVAAKADQYKTKADESFESLGPVLKDAVVRAIDTAGTVSSNTAEMINTIYGDIATDFRTALDDIVSPDLVAIAQKADAADQTHILEQIASSTASTASSSEETAENTSSDKTRLADQFGLNLSEGISSVFSSMFGSVSGNHEHDLN